VLLSKGALKYYSTITNLILKCLIFLKPLDYYLYMENIQFNANCIGLISASVSVSKFLLNGFVSFYQKLKCRARFMSAAKF
jgi:hypothetical protein